MVVETALDDTRWEAVLARSVDADGTFILGVLTTGIYCRPSCPARRPLRKNIRFFDNVDQARAAGLRACRRCAPDASMRPRSELVHDVCTYLDQHLDEAISLETLAAWVGVTRYHLQRTFKAATGVSPHEYLSAKRRDALKTELKAGKSLIASRAETGAGRADIGMSSKTYRRAGYGETIQVGFATSGFGEVLVATTKRGVCAIQLGESREAMTESLREEYFNASIVDGDDEIAKRVVDFAEGQLADLDLPEDIRATAFQERVWSQLREIPRGETRTYQQVADAMGAPSSVRAVANACGANPLALVVPCHRVVATGGGLGGYRYGTERKKRILVQEQ